MKTFVSNIKILLSDLSNLFFPQVCLTCNNLLQENENLICHHCLSDMPFTRFPFGTDNPVYNKLAALVPIQNATSVLIFHKTGLVQELIHQLKYRNRQSIGELIAEWTIQLIDKQYFSSQVDCIVPVPLHPKKYKKRGYNQLTVFGKTLEKILHVPYREDILIRTVNTESQTKKSLEQRRHNVATAFSISQSKICQNKHFLIIDDVMTTGATLEACAHTILQQIPGARISILTMAIVL